MKYLLYSKSAAQYVDGISVTTSYDHVEGRNMTTPKFSTSALMGNALAFETIAKLQAFVSACMDSLAGFAYDPLNFRIDAFEEGVTDGNATEEDDSGEGVQDGE